MDSTVKPKKILSPDQLEKLKLARVKALEVRQRNALKMKEISELEKHAKEKEINTKIENLKKIVEPTPQANEIVEPLQPKENLKKVSKPKQNKHEKLKNIIEAESDSSNSDDEDVDDKEDLIKDYLKTKYKQKYRHKYESKTLNQLTKGLANNHVKARLNDEMVLLASKNIFG